MLKKRMLGILAATLVVATTAACSGEDKQPQNSASPESSASSAPTAETPKDPVTLKVMLFNEKPNDMKVILDEFEKRTKDTLNTKLDMEFNPAPDHKQKVKLMMTSGESADMIFDAPWMNLNDHVSQGLYYELDKYFLNDEYPGLKKAFSKEYLDANKMNGHNYYIPFTQYYTDMNLIMVRKDLREKYKLPEIQSYDDLKSFLDVMKENEDNKELTYFNVNPNVGFDFMFRPDTVSKNPSEELAHVRVDNLGTGIDWVVGLSEDGKKVTGAVTYGDPADKFANMPAPFNSPNSLTDRFQTFLEWSEYLDTDVLTNTNISKPNGAAAQNNALGSGLSVANIGLKQTVPHGEWEYFIPNEAIRNLKEGALGTTYKAWNGVVIPKTSKNLDRVMEFFDWLFLNQENHDLFELGIEGTHWESAGDNSYRRTELGIKNYYFPPYQLTWNPIMSKTVENDEFSTKLLEYQAKESSYYRYPLANFAFDSSNVNNELAKVQPKFQEMKQILFLGLDKNWEASLNKAHSEMLSLGLDKIRDELMKQIQEYLDNGGQ